MDLLTHIAIGAAAGEAILGKKIGNRAMALGAFGGVLPDFDVFASVVTDEITALEFHRGITHSFVFAVLISLGLSWLTEHIYRSGTFKRRWYKAAVFFSILFLIIAISGGLNYFAFTSKNSINLQVLAGTIAACIWLGWLVWRRYYRREREVATATRGEWFALFLASIFSHIIIDCFTLYGTQVFLPFSNYAVAFNTISVLDPLFTLPALVCVIIATFKQKEKKSRRQLAWFGMGLSAAYLLFTCWHKLQSDRIFERSLVQQGIAYQRFMTAPTILNNFLWQGIAEGDTAFFHGSYSFFDEAPIIRQFNILPKNHDIIVPYENDNAIQVLKWFTKGYFNSLKISDNKFQINDLRYGSTEENFASEDKYVFRFIIEEKNGRLVAHQRRAYHRISWEGLKKLIKRISGKRD